jgi:hypothetical protein
LIAISDETPRQAARAIASRFQQVAVYSFEAQFNTSIVSARNIRTHWMDIRNRLGRDRLRDIRGISLGIFLIEEKRRESWCVSEARNTCTSLQIDRAMREQIEQMTRIALMKIALERDTA